MTATCADGYRALAVCPVLGPNAAQKAQKTAEAILKRYLSQFCWQRMSYISQLFYRTRNMFKLLQLGDYSQTHVQVRETQFMYLYMMYNLC